MPPVILEPGPVAILNAVAFVFEPHVTWVLLRARVVRPNHPAAAVPLMCFLEAKPGFDMTLAICETRDFVFRALIFWAVMDGKAHPGRHAIKKQLTKSGLHNSGLGCAFEGGEPAFVVHGKAPSLCLSDAHPDIDKLVVLVEVGGPRCLGKRVKVKENVVKKK